MDVPNIYLKLFEIGISNAVCGCILGWWRVVYYLPVAVTLNLTSDLVFFCNNCIWSISLILLEIGTPNLLCEGIFGW